MSAEEIVRYFYGDDVNFVRNAPISHQTSAARGPA